MSTITISALEPARWPEYKAIRLQALQQEASAFGVSYEENAAQPDTFWQERLQSSQDKDGNRTLFAEVDGQVVGMMGAFWNNRPKVKHNVSIYGVYVMPEYRSSGVARRLFDALLDEIKAIGQFERIELNVNTIRIAAIKFYQSYDFKIVGTISRILKIDDVYYDEYIMERFL